MSWNTPKHRYAWLEQDEGMWHFLTDLFADPGRSTRKWTDRNRALEELRNEGWTVVAPYPDNPSVTEPSAHNACGYGLMWISDSYDIRDAGWRAPAPHIPQFEPGNQS